LRRLAALERQKIVDEAAELERLIADYQDILATPARQRAIVSEELAEIVRLHGDERRSRFLPADDMGSEEDLIPVRDVVVSITEGGYAKRTDSTLYRSQRRGGRGVKGAALQRDDVVEHFFVTTTHHWILFFTNHGRVYRTKAYMLPETARDAKGKHVANLLAFQPDEQIAGVLALKDYEQAPYLVMATKDGLVKKTALTEYDTNRTGGLIAINLKDGDELVSARLVDDHGELIMVSAKGMSVRFRADDLRAMGRATSGVIGMRFRDGDYTLSMDVVRDGCDLVTVTDCGFAKRTPLSEWNTKGRAGLGVRAMKLVEERGSLVGALVCEPSDTIFAIASNGVVIRTKVDQVRQTSRDTMGVSLMGLPEGVTLVAVARSADEDDDSDPAPDEEPVTGDDEESVDTASKE
jgi:DNA gyrase subunit A